MNSSFFSRLTFLFFSVSCVNMIGILFLTVHLYRYKKNSTLREYQRCEKKI